MYGKGDGRNELKVSHVPDIDTSANVETLNMCIIILCDLDHVHAAC